MMIDDEPNRPEARVALTCRGESAFRHW